jgi:hypothetical protein
MTKEWGTQAAYQDRPNNLFSSLWLNNLKNPPLLNWALAHKKYSLSESNQEKGTISESSSKNGDCESDVSCNQHNSILLAP